jgi:broad specificity phosphatase PhoE
MRLYVIRHGETSWNVARKLQGHQGADLDEKGVQLAEITARGMKDIPFELCFTSPLPRARHTAEIILAGRDVPVIEEPRIMEIGFGEWEGLCCAPGRSEIPGDGFEKFHRAPFEYTAPPGGESIRDVCRRTKEFFQELIHDPEYQDMTILISTHGCASRAFLNNVYEDKEDFWHGGVPANCAVSIVDVRDGKAVLTESDKIYYEESDRVDYFKAEEDEKKS